MNTYKCKFSYEEVGGFVFEAENAEAAEALAKQNLPPNAKLIELKQLVELDAVKTQPETSLKVN